LGVGEFVFLPYPDKKCPDVNPDTTQVRREGNAKDAIRGSNHNTLQGKFAVEKQH